MNATSSDSYVFCSSYMPPNHVYFQMGNLLMLISYLAPDSMGGLLYLRITLALGLMFLGLWGYVVLCALDTFLWSFVCMWINVLHILYLAWTLRPVHVDLQFEQIYRTLFAPLKVSRRQFNVVLRSMRRVRTLRFQEALVEEGVTRLDSLTLVLSGRFVVTQKQQVLHVVSENEFLDSPEWFIVCTDDLFKVSVTAIQDSRVLEWHRDKLKLDMMNDPFMQAVLDKILGRDVVKKLLQVDEKLTLFRGESLGEKASTFVNRTQVYRPVNGNGVTQNHQTDCNGESPTQTSSWTEGSDNSGWKLDTIAENSKECTRL